MSGATARNTEHLGAVGPGLTFGLSGLTAHAAGRDRTDYHAALRHIVETSVLAEEVGFDAVWTCEHHFSTTGYLPTPFVPLAAIAERTERVTVGTDVLLLPMWDPVRLAEEANVTDQLSRGRLIIGAGLGWRDLEFEGLGTTRAQRVPRMRESIRVLRESETGYVSGVGSVPDDVSVPCAPLPFQPAGIPLWIGAYAEKAVRRARHVGDGYFNTLTSPAAFAERVGWLAEEGELDDGYAIAQTTLVFVAPSRALDIVGPGFAHMNEEYEDWDSGGADDAPSTNPSDEEQAHSIVFGTPDECIERLRPFVEVLASRGPRAVTHLSARLTYPGLSDADNDASIRLFGSEVAPALKEIAASAWSSRI